MTHCGIRIRGYLKIKVVILKKPENNDFGTKLEAPPPPPPPPRPPSPDDEIPFFIDQAVRVISFIILPTIAAYFAFKSVF